MSKEINYKFKMRPFDSTRLRNKRSARTLQQFLCAIAPLATKSFSTTTVADYNRMSSMSHNNSFATNAWQLFNCCMQVYETELMFVIPGVFARLLAYFQAYPHVNSVLKVHGRRSFESARLVCGVASSVFHANSFNLQLRSASRLLLWGFQKFHKKYRKQKIMKMIKLPSVVADSAPGRFNGLQISSVDYARLWL